MVSSGCAAEGLDKSIQYWMGLYFSFSALLSRGKDSKINRSTREPPCQSGICVLGQLYNGYQRCNVRGRMEKRAWRCGVPGDASGVPTCKSLFGPSTSVLFCVNPLPSMQFFQYTWSPGPPVLWSAAPARLSDVGVGGNHLCTQTFYLAVLFLLPSSL